MLLSRRSNNARVMSYLSQHTRYDVSLSVAPYVPVSTVLPLNLALTSTKYGDHPALYETGGSTGHRGVSLSIFRPDFTLCKAVYVWGVPTVCNQNHAQIAVCPGYKLITAYYQNEQAVVGQFTIVDLIQDEQTGRPMAVAEPDWIRSCTTEELKWYSSPNCTPDYFSLQNDQIYRGYYIASHKVFDYMTVRPKWIKYWSKVPLYPDYNYHHLFTTQTAKPCTSFTELNNAITKAAYSINRKKNRPFLLHRAAATEIAHVYKVDVCMAVAKSRGGGLRQVAYDAWTTFVQSNTDTVWYPDKEPWSPHDITVDHLIQQVYATSPDQTLKLYTFQG